MIVASWVMFILLLTLLFNGLLSERENPNRRIAVETDGPGSEVVLKRNRSGHYLAPGKINSKPVLFLVDTGATDVAVPEPLALKLGLKKGMRSQSITANGRVTVWRTVIDEVRLGPIVQRRVTAVILPNMPGGQILLGMSFLGDLELLQRDDQLRIRVDGGRR